MPRKLVTVRCVSAVKPIPGADRIETAVVDGWQCVVKVGDFRAGDLGLFFEIDCFLPAADPRWAFLEPQFTTFEDGRGFRVRSAKMRGQISQGLLQPLGVFPEVAAVLEELTRTMGGREAAVSAVLDRTFEEMLGVRKWGRAIPGGAADGKGVPLEQQIALGPFPDFVERTDQERIQNLPRVFDEWGDKVFQETTKMDGSSMTVYFLRKDAPMFDLLPALNPTGGQSGLTETGRLGVCSRNIELVERTTSMFWEAALKHKLPEKLAKLDRNIAIQGELCGSTIQSNFEGFPKGFHEFYLYSVWDIDKQRHLAPRETEQWAKDLGLKHVPVHGYAKLNDIGTSVEELLARADGKGINGKKREGIVLKHEDGAFSFKAISNSYLLKHGE